MVSGQVINFCRPAQMSTCTAAGQKEQVGCSFYEKSRHAERCMYFIFEEYCSCIKAQISATASAATCLGV